MYSSLQLPVVQLKALDHQKMSALKILANVYCDEVPSNDDDNNDVIHDIYTDLEHKSFDTMMLCSTHTERRYYRISLFILLLPLRKERKSRRVDVVCFKSKQKKIKSPNRDLYTHSKRCH